MYGYTIVIWGAERWCQSHCLPKTNKVTWAVCVFVCQGVKGSVLGVGDITPAKPVFLLAALPKTRFNRNGKCWTYWGSKRLDSTWIILGQRNKTSCLHWWRETRRDRNICCVSFLPDRTHSFDDFALNPSLNQELYGESVQHTLTSCQTHWTESPFESKERSYYINTHRSNAKTSHTLSGYIIISIITPLQPQDILHDVLFSGFQLRIKNFMMQAFI